jgi:hypothetical protein
MSVGLHIGSPGRAGPGRGDCMKAGPSVLALVGAVLLAGCAHLTHLEVIGIAKQAAERQGYHLRNYRKPAVRYEIGPEGKCWSVFFDCREPFPGNHFYVIVNDRSGVAKVMGGL